MFATTALIAVLALVHSPGLLLAQTPTETKPAAAPTTPPPPDKVFKAEDVTGLKGHLGHKVTVEGKVLSLGESTSGTVLYLDFTKDWERSAALTFFRKKNDSKIAKENLEPFVGKTVRATGLLAEHQRRVQVQVSSLEDVKVIDSTTAPSP